MKNTRFRNARFFSPPKKDSKGFVFRLPTEFEGHRISFSGSRISNLLFFVFCDGTRPLFLLNPHSICSQDDTTSLRFIVIMDFPVSLTLIKSLIMVISVDQFILNLLPIFPASLTTTDSIITGVATI